MVFNATLRYISVRSWWSVLLVEETDLSQVTDKFYHIHVHVHVMLYRVLIFWWMGPTYNFHMEHPRIISAKFVKAMAASLDGRLHSRCIYFWPPRGKDHPRHVYPNEQKISRTQKILICLYIFTCDGYMHVQNVACQLILW